MYITQETDYAARIVYCLSKSQTRKDAKTISQEADVTLRFSLKILNKLVQSNIVVSYKGAKGGYELSKSPSEISLLDVMEATQGKYKMVKCIGDDYECNHGFPGMCSFKRAFAQISEETNEKLKNITFDTL